MTQTAIQVNGLLTVTVQVSDHDRAVAFYTKTLGMEVRRDASYGPGLRWVEVAPAGAATTISLAPPRGELHPADTGIRLSAPDAEGIHAELRSQGVDVDADLLRVPGVPPMFSFRDPDGNTLYLVEMG
jgi:catechol 2,3-dioxygenase-like lactoylglutathione lyase family enzyme